MLPVAACAGITLLTKLMKIIDYKQMVVAMHSIVNCDV